MSGCWRGVLPGGNDLLRRVFRSEQLGLCLRLQFGFDYFGQVFQSDQLILIQGDTDMADDALSDGITGAHRRDDLHRLTGAVGGGFHAYEHRGKGSRDGKRCQLIKYN